MKAPCTEPCGDSSCLPCPPGTFLARDSHFKTDCTRCQVCDEEGKGVAAQDSGDRLSRTVHGLLSWVREDGTQVPSTTTYRAFCLSPVSFLSPRGLSLWSVMSSLLLLPVGLASAALPGRSSPASMWWSVALTPHPCSYVRVPTFLHPLSQPFR